MNGQNDEEPEELLGDLEQIRELLDEEEQAAADDVPLLDDVVDGGISVSEPNMEARATLASGRPPVLPDETIDALLGDAWRESTSEILDSARGAIEADRIGWAPDDTDELHEALKVRIDDAIGEWMRELVQANIDDLRSRLDSELGAALREHLKGDLPDS